MAQARVNISIDENILSELDSLADDMNMNRSETIALMVKAMGYMQRNDFNNMVEFVVKRLRAGIKEKMK